MMGETCHADEDNDKTTPIMICKKRPKYGRFLQACFFKSSELARRHIPRMKGM